MQEPEKPIYDLRSHNGIPYDLYFLPNPLDPIREYEEIRRRNNATWKDRLEFAEWKWVNQLPPCPGALLMTFSIFTVNLGTGAVSLLLANTFEWGGQRGLGTAFYLLNLVIYICNWIIVTLRAVYHPQAFRASFSHPPEALFFPASLLGGATLFVGTLSYGVPYCGFWLVRALYVAYFVYVILSIGCAALLQWTLYDQKRDLISITPAESLPLFPLMLGGTLGAALSLHLPDNEAVYIILLSYILQGLGYWISLQKLSSWMLRNVILGQPSDKRLIPVFFMACGPPGFTAYAVLTLGFRAQTAFASQNILPSVPNAGDIVFATSLVLSLLWLGQACWYIIMTLSMWIKGFIVERPAWGMAWWALTFPLVGFFLTFERLGLVLPSQPCRRIEVVGCCVVAFFWLLNLCIFSISIVGGRILVPPVRPPPIEPRPAKDSGQTIAYVKEI